MAVTLRTFHNIADLGTFVLSFGANLLLLWLVTFKTSKEFRAYSRVLTLSAIMDALFALLGPIASPVSTHRESAPFDDILYLGQGVIQAKISVA